MLRLAGMLYGIVAMSLAGAGVVVVLASGVSEFMPILAAAVIGAILALPVSFFVAGRLLR
jgi:hypothetical protein